mgnify:CR=1 FL=1
MNEQKCANCKQQMLEIGGVGKSVAIGDYIFDVGNGTKKWQTIGMRESKLYQCQKCKIVLIY